MSEQNLILSFFHDLALLKVPSSAGDRKHATLQEEVEGHQKSQALTEKKRSTMKSYICQRTARSRDVEEADEIKIVSCSQRSVAQEGGVPKSNRSFIFFGGKDSNPEHKEHLGGGWQSWRNFILGVNNGLVATFLLVAGVTGARLSNNEILITVISGTIAGAIAMAAGEYVATKTQQEVMDGEIQKLERKHIQRNNKEDELEELAENLTKIGIPKDDQSDEVVTLRRQLLSYYQTNNEAHLKAQIALELGKIEEDKRNPFVAGGIAFVLFLVGALPNVIPFAVTQNTNAAFIGAAIVTTLDLLFVGAIKTWATRGSMIVAAIEILVLVIFGVVFAYGVGLGFGKILNES